MKQNSYKINTNKKPSNNISKKTHTQKALSKIICHSKMFDISSIPKDAQDIINSFDKIVQNVFPANSKQMSSLHYDINNLSHELTDERVTRRTGYMNDIKNLSAYVRYFSWWNIIRLTRLFSNFGKESFNLSDGDVCLDVGSGPLTVVIALWLSRPELRNKKLTWYCIDISQSALTLGESLYLSIASRLPPTDSSSPMHWSIIRVKGSIGTHIKQKASLVICANMFNELAEKDSRSYEERAKSYSNLLLSYTANLCDIIVIEPGVPTSAHIISLMRNIFIEKNMNIVSPCPHKNSCPLNGLNARTGSKSKWCNFAFSVEDAPMQLQKLSAESKLAKRRAVLSFIFATTRDKKIDSDLSLRIASDKIKLAQNSVGYYACSEFGLTLAVNNSKSFIQSGDYITLQNIKDKSKLLRDKKTSAIKIDI